MSGSDAAGGGPALPPLASRARSSSRAMIATPIFARFSLPPVWSGCTCVLIMKRMGPSEILRMAATIFSLSGANCESTISTPSGAGEHADRAALTVEGVEIPRQFGRLDLDLAEVGWRRRWGRRLRPSLRADNGYQRHHERQSSPGNLRLSRASSSS